MDYTALPCSCKPELVVIVVAVHILKPPSEALVVRPTVVRHTVSPHAFVANHLNKRRGKRNRDAVYSPQLPPKMTEDQINAESSAGPSIELEAFRSSCATPTETFFRRSYQHIMRTLAASLRSGFFSYLVRISNPPPGISRIASQGFGCMRNM